MRVFADNVFSRRRRGQVPLPVLFWRDIPGVGTVVSLVEADSQPIEKEIHDDR